jgi:hypothetical protein
MVEPPIEIVSRSPGGGQRRSTITGPTQLARLGVSLRTLSEDLVVAVEDDAGRSRVRRLHERAVQQVEAAVSGALGDELAALGVLELPEDASPGELRLANAQLLGWLKGLFQQLDEALSPQEGAGEGTGVGAPEGA